MARIALSGATIAQSTASGHITYRRWEFTGRYTERWCAFYDGDGHCVDWRGGDPIYEWRTYTTSANINGTVTAPARNVRVEGFSPVLEGDSTQESDTYTIPDGGEYVSGSHSSATGRVSRGNSRNVFINGVSVAVEGSSVTTHASTNTTINGGVSSTVHIG